MTRSIADAIRERADRELHSDFLWHANRLCREYRDNAPRIDTGEGWIDLERRINAYLEVFSEEAGVQLRPIAVAAGADGNPAAFLTPMPPISQPTAAHGDKETTYVQAPPRRER